MRCSFEEADEMAGRLFEAESDPGVGKLLAELEQPFPKRFRAGIDDTALTITGTSVDEMEIGLAIRAIQADEEFKRMRSEHGNLSD